MAESVPLTDPTTNLLHQTNSKKAALISRPPRVLLASGRITPYSTVRASGRNFLLTQSTLHKLYSKYKYVAHCQEIIMPPGR